MGVVVCSSTVYQMIDLLKKKREHLLKKEDVEKVLNHEDYQFEFRRYEERLKLQEVIEYIMTFESLETEQIQNKDLTLISKNSPSSTGSEMNCCYVMRT